MNKGEKQKYYEVTVEVKKTYKVTLPAQNDKDAMQQIYGNFTLTDQKEIDTSISCNRVELKYETEFCPGTKVCHCTFGTGVIQNVSQGRNVAGESISAEILFDDGQRRNIVLSVLSPDKFYAIP